MMNTDDIQVVPGSVFLARSLHSKKRRSEWHYLLQQFTSPQRQGRGSAANLKTSKSRVTLEVRQNSQEICPLLF